MKMDKLQLPLFFAIKCHQLEIGGIQWQKLAKTNFHIFWGGGGGGGGMGNRWKKNLLFKFFFLFFVFLKKKKEVLTQVRSKFYHSYTGTKTFATIIRK